MIIKKEERKKKRTCRKVDLILLSDYKVKIKEIEKRDQYVDLTTELKKAVEHEGVGDIKF